jgi:hypothetical protein
MSLMALSGNGVISILSPLASAKRKSKSRTGAGSKREEIHSLNQGNGLQGPEPDCYFAAALMLSPKNFQVLPSNLARRKVLNVE